MNSQSPAPSRRNPVLIGVLVIIALGLIVYKLALGWTPIWLDLIVLTICGVVWLVSDAIMPRAKERIEDASKE